MRGVALESRVEIKKSILPLGLGRVAISLAPSWESFSHFLGDVMFFFEFLLEVTVSLGINLGNRPRLCRVCAALSLFLLLVVVCTASCLWCVAFVCFWLL